MEINYEELRRIQRLEKNTSKLVEVESDFFNSLNEFMKNEKQEYLDSLKDTNNVKAKNYLNLKKLVEEIYELREKKILMNALLASRDNELENQENMALEEKQLCEKLIRVLSEQRCILNEIFSENKVSFVENKVIKSCDGIANDLNKLSVKMLKEVPSFVGPDSAEYGPFQESQLVELPYKIAKLFVERKFAVIEGII